MQTFNRFALIAGAAIALAVPGMPDTINGVANQTYTPVSGLAASKPGTCGVGQLYFATDAPAGQNLYFCTAPNTWTQQAGGSATATGSTAVVISANAASYNVASYNAFSTTLNQNLTTMTIAGTPVDGRDYWYTFTQDATGGRTVTCPASFSFISCLVIPDALQTTTIHVVWSATANAFLPPGASGTHGYVNTSSAPSGTPPSGTLFSYYSSANNRLELKDSGANTTGTVRDVASVAGQAITAIVGGVPTQGIVAMQTAANCSSSASPAVCAAASSGSVAVAAAATTVQVNTTAVTASSQILITFDSSLGTKLSVTCNTTPVQPTVSARTAGTSFTLTVPSAPSTNPACFSYTIIN